MAFGLFANGFKEPNIFSPSVCRFGLNNVPSCDIPFANKDKAKALGAKWDGNVKKWFYVDNLDADKIARLLKLSK